AERATGLRVGGISPLAVAPGRFDVWLHRAALGHGTVFLSAGLRGREVELAPDALCEHLGAREFG
ncbi:MAG TPA: Cys-tRNA(Pro) deacylase, partial [Planctomycetota bacterium]|nr:Cys-tRNA(Pro) deacylase [Planctomycetota bacterium]